MGEARCANTYLLGVRANLAVQLLTHGRWFGGGGSLLM